MFPNLAAEIAELLRAGDEDALADAVGDLRYFGPCTCSPTCTNLLTAPAGSSGFAMTQLTRDGQDVIWLSLDPTTTTITDIEVLDGRDLLSDGEEEGLPGSGPISVALQRLGVTGGRLGWDEFDAVGLGRHRTTDRWG